MKCDEWRWKKQGGRTPEFPNSIREFRCATPLVLRVYTLTFDLLFVIVVNK